VNSAVELTKEKTRTAFKYGRMSVVVIVIAIISAHFIWKSSGTSEWKIVKDENGMKIESMKIPGDVLLKYKLNMRVKAPLSDLVFYMTDINTGRDLGAIDVKRLEHVVAPPVVISYDTYKIDLGSPIGLREVVILNQYSQDPVTKVVSINILAAPNELSPNDTVTRLVHLSNHWTYTPLENGEVNVQLISDMDLRLPYLLSNLVFPKVMYDTTDQMRILLKTAKFQNKHVDYVTELN